jgi:hypothetical protein
MVCISNIYHFHGAIGNLYGVVGVTGHRCIKKPGYLVQIDPCKNNFSGVHGRIL